MLCEALPLSDGEPDGVVETTAVFELSIVAVELRQSVAVGETVTVVEEQGLTEDELDWVRETVAEPLREASEDVEELREGE